jgi:uncharacterized protein YqeY
MNLRQQLQQDLQEAIRARDERRKAALRMVLLSVQMAEAEGRTLSDADIVTLIRKEVKKREEALEMIRKAGREDLAATDSAELEVLRAYLPKLMDDEAITAEAEKAIAEVGAASPADLGKVMRVLMPRLRGKADGKRVNQIVRQLLAQK